MSENLSDFERIYECSKTPSTTLTPVAAARQKDYPDTSLLRLTARCKRSNEQNILYKIKCVFALESIYQGAQPCRRISQERGSLMIKPGRQILVHLCCFTMRGALWQIEQKKNTTPPWARRDSSQADVDIIQKVIISLKTKLLLVLKATGCFPAPAAFEPFSPPRCFSSLRKR